MVCIHNSEGSHLLGHGPAERHKELIKIATRGKPHPIAIHNSPQAYSTGKSCLTTPMTTEPYVMKPQIGNVDAVPMLVVSGYKK